jgi:hypothetical protein
MFSDKKAAMCHSRESGNLEGWQGHGFRLGGRNDMLYLIAG